MNSPADSLKRCPQRFSILLIGNTGHGKSATINHLLNTDTIKTNSSTPESRETVEYLLAVKNGDNEGDSDMKLGIIETPGLNDPRGIKQDACNLYSMKHFFETHPRYSAPKCYPNLVFLVISANEHRIDGTNSKLANTLRALKELDVVDKHHPNVVAALTFCCSNSRNVLKWETNMEEKKDTISRNIFEALGIQVPVVLLENDMDSYCLEKCGDFTVLPNDERQPKNLYEVCQIILKENGDHNGLATFNIGLAQNHGHKKQYQVAYHKVIANDSKNPISEDEQDLLNILRGSTEHGVDNVKNSCHLVKADSANNPICKDQQDSMKFLRGKTEDEVRREPWRNLNGNRRRPNIITTVAILFILFCIIAGLAVAFFVGLKE